MDFYRIPARLLPLVLYVFSAKISSLTCWSVFSKLFKWSKRMMFCTISGDKDSSRICFFSSNLLRLLITLSYEILPAASFCYSSLSLLRYFTRAAMCSGTSLAISNCLSTILTTRCSGRPFFILSLTKALWIFSIGVVLVNFSPYIALIWASLLSYGSNLSDYDSL